MTDILNIEEIKKGFEPSIDCLQSIAGTRKTSNAMKLGNINYYGWYRTHNAEGDRNNTLIAFALETLIFISLFLISIKNGSLSIREWIVLGFTGSFVLFDFIAFNRMHLHFFDVNTSKQTIEILEGTGEEAFIISQHRENLKKYNSYYKKWASLLVISFLLKVIGILVTTGLTLTPKIALIVFSTIILILHYNYSPYYFKYRQAKKRYEKELRNSIHHLRARNHETEVPKNNELIGAKDIIPTEAIKDTMGLNFIIFEMRVAGSNILTTIYNNQLLYDEYLITTVLKQSTVENRNKIAKLLIQTQLNSIQG